MAVVAVAIVVLVVMTAVVVVKKVALHVAVIVKKVAVAIAQSAGRVQRFKQQQVKVSQLSRADHAANGIKIVIVRTVKVIAISRAKRAKRKTATVRRVQINRVVHTAAVI